MLEEWTYRYKPRVWHFIAPVIVAMLGWHLVHNGGGLLDWFFAVVFGLIALLMSSWMAFTGSVAALLDYNYEQTGEHWTDPHIDQKYDYDYRWALWARQVLAGRPIAREKWTGPGKLFTRPEYEKRLWHMKNKGVLVYNNGRDDNQGYRINGEGGRVYIEAIAAGRTNLPLPAPLPRPGTTPNEAVMPAREPAREGEAGEKGWPENGYSH